MRKIRVLVVDDAVVVRQITARVLEEDPQIEVIGTAPNGRVALAKIGALQPDVITLDVAMPEMDGLQLLEALRQKGHKVAVIMYSVHTEHGAQVAMDALALGAVDYVTKPASQPSSAEAMEAVRRELVPRIKAIGGGAAGLSPAAASASAFASVMRISKPPAGERKLSRRMVQVLAIGSSTGGPNALVQLFEGFPADFPVPVVIVQHMPPVFTRLLAQRLSGKSGLQVREAEGGEALQPGLALMAPGDYHMVVRREGDLARVALHQGPPENSCRPAVDVLFRSLAQTHGGAVLAVVLTGMGQDGTRGADEIARTGGQIVVQDEASSVVWGMPGSVAAAGLAERVLPLHELGGEIFRRVAEGRTWLPPRRVG